MGVCCRHVNNSRISFLTAATQSVDEESARCCEWNVPRMAQDLRPGAVPRDPHRLMHRHLLLRGPHRPRAQRGPVQTGKSHSPTRSTAEDQRTGPVAGASEARQLLPNLDMLGMFGGRKDSDVCYHPAHPRLTCGTFAATRLIPALTHLQLSDQRFLSAADVLHLLGSFPRLSTATLQCCNVPSGLGSVPTPSMNNFTVPPTGACGGLCLDCDK